MTEKNMYQELGVDADKRSIREIFSGIVKNDFPGAFVNIARNPDIPGLVRTKHPDGDGSKMIQRLLHYLETGQKEIIQGAVDDAFSMNASDIATSGFVFGTWFVTDIININALNVPKELILKQIALRLESLFKLYAEYGFKIFFLGGETADLPNQVNSAVFDMDVWGQTQEANLILGNVRAGDKIWGFASDGQAAWESAPNSGIMANGLTLARLSLMKKEYGKKYPFLVGSGKEFRGRFEVNYQPVTLCGLTVSQALLSPTRQWAILIRLLLEELEARGITGQLHGISMNTGGGATKITHVGRGGIVYEKTMPIVPPIFQLIQMESGENWRNMYQAFNCGVGLDIVGENSQELDDALFRVRDKSRVRLYELGKCYLGKQGEPNRVILKTPYGDFCNYHK